MQVYRNGNGDSNVAAYEFTADSITVKFKDNMHYLYTAISAGIDKIENMKKLATQGHGLNSYIMKYVRKKYARKW